MTPCARVFASVWIDINNNNKFALLIEVENKQANNPLIALPNLSPTCRQQQSQTKMRGMIIEISIYMVQLRLREYKEKLNLS